MSVLVIDPIYLPSPPFFPLNFQHLLDYLQTIQDCPRLGDYFRSPHNGRGQPHYDTHSS